MGEAKIEPEPKKLKTRVDTFLWVFYFARRLRAVKKTKSLKTLGFFARKKVRGWIFVVLRIRMTDLFGTPM